MKKIQEQADTLRINLAAAADVVEHYHDAWDDNAFISQDYEGVFSIYTRDAATAGEVLGRGGWTRKLQGNQVNWQKDVVGVRVTILNAENPNLDGSPVPIKAFPLALPSGSTE